MSSTPTTASPSSHAPAAQAAARQSAQGARKPAGPENGGDPFSNLLMLLSATTDALPTEGWIPETPTDAAATAVDHGETPLEAMLAWVQRPGATPGAAGTDPGTRGSPPDPRSATASPGFAEGATAPASPQASGTPIDERTGLQALARPQAPDAATLARLDGTAGDVGAAPTAPTLASPEAPGAGPTAPASPHTNAAATGRPAAWRATTQMTGTSALQQWHHAQNQNAPATERSAVRVDVGPAMALRSTVALDQRFAQSEIDEAAGPTPTAASTLLATASAGADNAGHAGTGADAGADHGADASDPSDAPDAARAEEAGETYEEAQAEAEARAEERFDRFTAPQLRQASLRVGEDGQDAIDVQLSLNGQELNLNFRTDNADARAELRQNAGGTLAELLEQGGLQLGQVHVGAQNRQAGQDAAADHRARSGHAPRVRSDAISTADTSPLSPPARPRSDGSRPLDLFV